MLMAARDDQAESRRFRQRHFQKLVPGTDAQLGFGRKKLVFASSGRSSKTVTAKSSCQRQRRDGLRDVAGAGNPQVGRRRNGFLIKPSGVPSGSFASTSAMEKSVSRPSGDWLSRPQFAPEFRRSAARGKISPLTLPPQIKPSSQPKSWSSTMSKRGGFAGLSAWPGAG